MVGDYHKSLGEYKSNIGQINGPHKKPFYSSNTSSKHNRPKFTSKIERHAMGLPQLSYHNRSKRGYTDISNQKMSNCGTVIQKKSNLLQENVLFSILIDILV